MNKIFYFYPHIHLKSTNKEFLAYDTLNTKHVYIKTNLLSQSDKDSLKMGFVKVSESLSFVINQCLINELGYLIDYVNILPFMSNRELEFVTSLSKERRALGYNLLTYTNSLLRTTTILLNNRYEGYPEELCLQMEYPKCNNTVIDIDHILYQLSSFQCLERIILSGELTTTSLCKVLEYAKDFKIHVTHRILFESIDELNSLEFIAKYNNLSIELLINNSSDISQIRSLSNEHIFVKAIVQSVNDVVKFSGIDNLMYLPILSSNNDNTEILQQMLLSEEEILHSKKSIKDCRLSDYINPDIFGHLTINYEGMVSCLGEEIASIFDFDLSSIVNNWVGSDKCNWYKTRRGKDTCKDCALQCLCPPISIYEEKSLYKCPCKI